MKLAAPSYLIPGTWLENLEAAASIEWLSGVELLFFSYDEDARRILSTELLGIAVSSDRLELSLHLPDPLSPADEELVEMTAPLVSLYVAHPPKAGSDLPAWADLLGSWRSRYGDRFLLEYTGREAFAAAERVLPGLPLCPDTGRLALDGEDPSSWIGLRADRVAELHLHAAREGRDHLPLSGDEPWLPGVLGLAAARGWRVVLECFSLEVASASARAVESSRTGARC
jgi:hypothetical protein